MGGGGDDGRMTDTPLLTLLIQNDLDALQLTADNLDRLLLYLCALARYINAKGGLVKLGSEHGDN